MKFPLRTLLVCATAWALGTELMVFDYIKFDAKRELLEAATRVLQSRQMEQPTP